MVRVEPLKMEDARVGVKLIFKNMTKQFGMVPNLFATIAQYPKALMPMVGLWQALFKESSIEKKLQELACLETSRINGCHYCLAHHTQMGKTAGINDKQLEAWKAGKLDDEFSDKERTVIEYAGQVTRDAESVPDELFGRLRSYFSKSEIVNLTLIICLMNVFNRVNGALGVELEKMPAGK